MAVVVVVVAVSAGDACAFPFFDWPCRSFLLAALKIDLRYSLFFLALVFVLAHINSTQKLQKDDGKERDEIDDRTYRRRFFGKKRARLVKPACLLACLAGKDRMTDRWCHSRSGKEE